MGVASIAKSTAFQLIPARGRKLMRLRNCRRHTTNFNLSPQGDGNSLRNREDERAVLFQFIPARGRKRLASIAVVDVRIISIYPRKGTETKNAVSASSDAIHFNLSSQGDGNHALMCLRSVYFYFNLSPQGDGNHGFVLLFCGGVVISTYPRKGTETVMDDFATGYLDFNLSPQGDGNGFGVDCDVVDRSISTYPRKGTETP